MVAHQVVRAITKGAPYLLAMGVLYAVSMRTEFLLFHTIVETFTVVIAAVVFIVAWNGRVFGEDGFFLVIGPAFGAVAVLDMLHALSFKGVGVVMPEVSPDLPIQLWTAARYVQSVSFLVACWAIGRRMRASLAVTAYGVLTATLVAVIFGTNLFPHCFDEEGGLTAFKVGSEAFACAALGVAALWMVRRRKAFDEQVLWLLLGSLGLTILSEFVLTRYAVYGDAATKLGHVLRVPAFYLLYQSVVQTGLRRPHELLFRELKQSEEELREEIAERERLARLNEAILGAMPSALLILDADLNVVGATREEIGEYEVAAALAAGKRPPITDVLCPAFVERAGLLERLAAAVASGQADEALGVPHSGSDHVSCRSAWCRRPAPDTRRPPDEQHADRYLDLQIRPFSPDGRTEEGEPRVLLAILDVTQRHVLEEQARQKSKLESIGTLAGGVAHDFNNILTGIIGYTSILLEDGVDESVGRGYLEQVNGLAERAAGLTRQLLVFSRRHTSAPVRLDVSACLEGLAKMLDRIIGEDVELRLAPAPDLRHVRADPVHIEQIVMNLAVNARDAMADGGVLTIETENVFLDEEYARDHVGVMPGPHVMIAVSDTGCGMDEATRERIFEPFFTTKEVGKGTGLGLPTVHGIVEQHGGNIWVYSEPGQGTTIRIYLPSLSEETGEPVSVQSVIEENGSEAILVVEDEPDVLEVVRQTLVKRGYEVLTADTPIEAEAVFEAHSTGKDARATPSEIRLLLTDVIMPQMRGPDLYERLARMQPSLRVLYMSGYTERAATGGSHVPEGAAFIQKPFTPAGLARKVRKVLNQHVEVCV